MEDETDDGRESDPIDEGTPRWVKVFGLVALLVVLIVVVVHLAGGGFHGHAMR
jgi:hypothetical protein